MANPARSFLLAAITALVAAPLFMPPSYSVIEHTTSESGAQGVPGAWVARLGFVCFAMGVALLVHRERRRWNPGTVVMHGSFAVCMLGAAAFSTRPWFEAPFDHTEDFLHSTAASVMGACFAIGVVSSLFDKTGARRKIRLVDVLAVSASVLVPMVMFNVEDIAGVMQRVMFAIAFWWYLETTHVRTGDRVAAHGTR